MQLKQIQGVENLYELLDDRGRSCFEQDAMQFKMSREMKRGLKSTLILISRVLLDQGLDGLDEFVEDDLLRRIDKNEKALLHNMWEVKSPAHGGRLFFIIDEDDNIIVSAVDKQATTDPQAQDKAIKRGIKRWEKLLNN